MLSLLTVFSCVVAISLALTITRDGFYDTKYNHLDIERVLNNKRLVTYYGQCLVGEGPCPPQGTELKRILPEALQTNCVRCTEKQKVTAYLAIRRLKKEYPKIWQRLQAVWDPTGELVSRFVNDVESNNKLEGISRVGPTINNFNQEPAPSPAENENRVNIFNRLGEEQASNEINNVNSVPPNTQRIRAPSTVAPVIQQIPDQIVLSTEQATLPESQSFTDPPVVSIINYRTTLRPTRFNMLPRPVDLGRLTANVFESIADVGTKVIRTGARIADMVISGVQASVRPLLITPNNNTN